MEQIKNISLELNEAPYNVSISFDRFETHHSDKDRSISLYSKINFKSDLFEYNGVIETVEIPYNDPTIGFLIDGSNKSVVNIYQRAPGFVLEPPKPNDKNDYLGTLNIITNSNGKISIFLNKGGLAIKLGSGGIIPIGVFLKAISGMPYTMLKSKMAFSPRELLNAFPPEISDKNLNTLAADKSKKGMEPTLEECVSEVYTKMLSKNKRGGQQTQATFAWKYSRVKEYIARLNFKNRENIESKLSIGHRAVGSFLAEDINVPIFDEEGNVTSFFIKKGTCIQDDDAREIRRHDITQLIITAERDLTIQDLSSMYFRVKGYQLGEDAAGYSTGTYINEEVLKDLNDTDLLALKVITPEGSKVVTRTDTTVTADDFISGINYYLTAGYMQKIDTNQYSIDNRAIVTFDAKVIATVKEVYQDLLMKLPESRTIKELTNTLRYLPSRDLKRYLLSSENRELTQPDLTNLLSKVTVSRKSSAPMPSAPKDMTSVQFGQYGRLDSLHAPESDKIGSVHQLSVFAKVNEETGEIVAPYEKVIDGVPTGEIEEISAAKERNKNIAAWNDDLSNEITTVRCNGDITTVSTKRVDYREISPYFDMSISRSMIPFAEYIQPKRSLMGTNMQNQAVPLLHPERALVATGVDTEIPCLYYTVEDLVTLHGLQVKADTTLVLLMSDWNKTFVAYTFQYGDDIFKHYAPASVSDKETFYLYNLNLKSDNIYKPNEIVLYYFSTDMKEYETWERLAQGKVPLVKDPKRPALALGKNLLIGYKTALSSTIDDAVLISDRLLYDDVFTSIQIFKYEYTLKHGEAIYPTNGIARLHSWVSSGEAVITIVKENSKLKKIKAKISGEITYVSHYKNNITVYVTAYHRAAEGDKVAGRYGNKSVIARILPHEMMPYDPETGEILDICLNPLGLPSRMNFGQVLEVALGAVMKKTGRIAVVSPFYPDIKQDVIEEYEAAGLKPKRLFNPMFGKYTERPVMTGYMYILKLEQISNLKVSAVGYPKSVDPVFGQPTGSDNEKKGQKIGEMETWALEACNMHKTLDDLFTWYADDEHLRKKIFTVLADGEDGPWNEAHEDIKANRSPNRNSLVTQAILRTYCLDLVPCGDFFRIAPLDLSKITTIISKNNLESSDQGSKWGKIKLQNKIVSPFWVDRRSCLAEILNVKSIDKIMSGKHMVSVSDLHIEEAQDLSAIQKVNYITGIDAIVMLLERTDISEAINRLLNKSEDVEPSLNSNVVYNESNETDITSEMIEDADALLGNETVPMTSRQIARFLIYLKEEGYNLDIFVLEYFPVMPAIFRQTTVINDMVSKHAFNKHLLRILNASSSTDIFKAVKDYIGYGKGTDKDLVSVRHFFLGKDSKRSHGKMRENVLSKRVGFSGRTVIIPASNVYMPPFFVGIPWYIALRVYDRLLELKLIRVLDKIAKEMETHHGLLNTRLITSLSGQQLSDVILSLWEFNYNIINSVIHSDRNTCMAFYNILRRYIREFIEGDANYDGTVTVDGKRIDPADLPDDANINASVVLLGRQPTLHKRSIRALFVTLVDGWCIHIHQAICKSYNADFDGDQEYIVALFGEAKVEALKKMHVTKDMISDKDGEFVLDLVQDTCLGLYCMTSYKNNIDKIQKEDSNVFFYDDATALQTDLEYGTLHYYDVVIYRNKETNNYYLSTAGRILLNTVIPNALTDIPFRDKKGIAKEMQIDTNGINFCELKFDDVWASTKPAEGRTNILIGSILNYTYETVSERETVLVCQKLYELGLIASDLYGVSMTLDDLSAPVDISDVMAKPKEKSDESNLLYQFGLIQLEEKEIVEKKAWRDAQKDAQKKILSGLPYNSNTYYMLHSGARGKPAQLMQSVGFVGTIRKTETDDIRTPILNGYGNGLTSFDLYQTTFSARMGVVSTQAETKNAGYATRQAVYMSNGFFISEDDCGISNSIYIVKYDTQDVSIYNEQGALCKFEELKNRFISDDTEGHKLIKNTLVLNSYLFTDKVLSALLASDIKTINLDGELFELKRKLTEHSKEELLSMYSYALPFVEEDFRITQKSLEYIEQMGLNEVIALTSNETLLDLSKLEEAYLEVDYDSSRYSLYSFESNEEVPFPENSLFLFTVKDTSEGYRYYHRLLDNGLLTPDAFKYLLFKKIRSIEFEDVTVHIRYGITDVFSNLIQDRIAIALPYLTKHHTVTERTLKEIEHYQLKYIPIRTTLTCKSKDCICSKCYGYKTKSNHLLDVGTNVGIAAAQSMCEPASQMTMNVTHSGGVRSGNLIGGLDYYRKLLKGRLVPKMDMDKLEQPTTHSGYIKLEKLNNNLIKIVDDDSSLIASFITEKERINLPDGVYVDKGDVIISGFTDLQKYSSNDIFLSALKTRYLLILEYDKVFSGNNLNVNSRNYEIFARLQTSQVFLCAFEDLPPIKSAGQEIEDKTGKYSLFVATQYEVVRRFTGIGAVAFEYIDDMLNSSILYPEENKMVSGTSNLFTGTPVGSKSIVFKPSIFVEKRVKEDSKISINKMPELSSDPFADLYSKLSNDTVANTDDDMPISKVEETVVEETTAEPEEPKKNSDIGKLSKFSLS